MGGVPILNFPVSQTCRCFHRFTKEKGGHPRSEVLPVNASHVAPDGRDDGEISIVESNAFKRLARCQEGSDVERRCARR